MEELKAYGDTNRLQWIRCDFSDLRQIDEIANQLVHDEKQIDALVCNAGIGVGSYKETTDRLDSHFQVNHLSQMHLLLTLLPVLQSTPNSRLVLQSSDLHRGAAPSTKFESLADINKDIGPAFLYSRTKLCQVPLVRAIERRMDEGRLKFKEGHTVFVNATHPGGVAIAISASGIKSNIKHQPRVTSQRSLRNTDPVSFHQANVPKKEDRINIQRFEKHKPKNTVGKANYANIVDAEISIPPRENLGFL